MASGTSNTDHQPLSARRKRAGAIAGLVGAVLLVNARSVSSGITPVRWLIRIDLEIGILALISSGATFIYSGWFGAGQPVVAVVGLLVALWVAAIAFVMLEDEEEGEERAVSR